MIDYLVIGKGLIGSAVLRYLSQASDNVAIVGPGEPPDVHQHQGVFASHYDQGRVTRKYSKDAIWAELANRAIMNYRALEEQSGLRFHYPKGCLRVLRQPDYEAMMGALKQTQKRFEMPLEVFTDKTILAERFPFLAFPEDFMAFFEPAPAGYINPRELIEAQLIIAKAQGASIYAETVTSLRYQADSVDVYTQEGRHIQTRKLVIATGAFANCFDIIEPKLALRVKSETTLLAQLSDAEAARYEAMPAVLYDFETAEIDDGYLLPPICYPDGQFYIKLGCNTASDTTLADLNSMRHWMIDGDSNQQKAAIQAMMQRILPGLRAKRFETKRCLVTYTPQGYPYIDQLNERTVIALGGNGSGAKSSDAIGQLAAQLILHGQWQDTLPAEQFRLKVH